MSLRFCVHGCKVTTFSANLMRFADYFSYLCRSIPEAATSYIFIFISGVFGDKRDPTITIESLLSLLINYTCDDLVAKIVILPIRCPPSPRQ